MAGSCGFKTGPPAAAAFCCCPYPTEQKNRHSAQPGATARAGQQSIFGNTITAGRAIEPVMTGATLLFRQPLLFLAFRATPVHFALAQIIRKKQSTAWTVFGPDLGYCGFTPRNRALKHHFTVRTPVLTF